MNSQTGKLSISRGNVVEDEDTLKQAFFVPKSRYYLINILAEEPLECGKSLGAQARAGCANQQIL